MEPAAAPAAGEWLFRAEFSGEEGSASLRLMLRREAPERFRLTAADALGQVRWELRRSGDDAYWVDPAARTFCRIDPQLPLLARLTLPSIAVTSLPGLLIGEWPPDDAVRTSGPGQKARELPFTGERPSDGTPGWASWTLWENGEPAAWFQRPGAESLLSIRRPAVQVRWRLTAKSDSLRSTASGQGSGEAPGGYSELVCAGNAIP